MQPTAARSSPVSCCCYQPRAHHIDRQHVHLFSFNPLFSMLPLSYPPMTTFFRESGSSSMRSNPLPRAVLPASTGFCLRPKPFIVPGGPAVSLPLPPRAELMPRLLDNRKGWEGPSVLVALGALCCSIIYSMSYIEMLSTEYSRGWGQENVLIKHTPLRRPGR